MQKLIDSEKIWIEETWAKIEKKLDRVSVKSRDKIPYSTENGIHDDCSYWEGARKIDQWTNGFWPGMMWLMYVATGKEQYKITAEIAEEKLDTVLTKYDYLSHDMGFMWHLASGANYRITKNPKSRERNLLAASHLACRYNPDGGFIRAWNAEDRAGWAIIDCMMNLPLLYWASEEIKDPRFRQIAMHHADKTLEHHVRPDGSVNHILEYDVNTGELLGKPSSQGYDPECSSWTRGQGWAIYGYVLSYIHTGEERYLDAAKRVAHYFISAVCNEGYVPYCDFRAPEEPLYYDTTAGALVACGLLEIAKAVPQHEKKLYFKAAIQMLKALEKDHCNWEENEDSILQNGTERYGRGVHIPIIYGDYYFVEALYKLKGYDMLLW